MADFTANLQQTLRPPFSLLDCDSNSELMGHIPQLNYQAAAAAAAAYDQQQSLLYQSIMGYYSDVGGSRTAGGDSFVNPQITPDFPIVHPNGIVVDHQPVSVETGTSGFRWSSEAEEEDMKNKKKQRNSDAMEDSSTSRNSSPPVSVSGNTSRPKNVSGRGKRGRSGDVKSKEEKPRDVVHVRAKRGQATDSHSLAERVRRGKINEKLKCLQDMVPGCYKAMGMAVMLDEIINYVQSLQNQVEFLSMKLAAASALQDFNIHQPNSTSSADNNTIQKTNTYHDASHQQQQQQQVMIDNLLNEGYNSHHHLQQQLQAALSCIEATWPLI